MSKKTKFNDARNQ